MGALVVLFALASACSGDAAGVEADAGQDSSDAASSSAAAADAGASEDAADEDASSTDDAGPGSVDAAPDTPAGPPPDCYEDPVYTCVSVPESGPYGERELIIPATQNWVNSGVYVRAGDEVELYEDGGWSHGTGSEGSPINHGPCFIGDLVARVGLYYEDVELTCVEGRTFFVAPKEGILYLGMLPSNDLGETYESRRNASGAKLVLVVSDGDTVPTVVRAAVDTYDFEAVASGWVELAGDHVLLTVPTSLALHDREILGAALDRLDTIYDLQTELRGATPYFGQRVRFIPDGTNPGYLLAGNPVRMQLGLTSTEQTDRITRAGVDVSEVEVWGPTHEFGHLFTFAGGGWTYQTSTTLESWPNLFSIYAYEALGIELHEATIDCSAESQGSIEHPSGDPWGGDVWLGLCFLRQFVFSFGWDFYQRFFAELNTWDPDELNGEAYGREWIFVREVFDQIAEDDERAEIERLFTAWDIPGE